MKLRIIAELAIIVIFIIIALLVTLVRDEESTAGNISAVELVRQGNELYKIGRAKFNEAGQKYLDALNINPDIPEARLKLADIYYEFIWNYDALNQLNELERIDPKYPGLYLLMGKIHNRIGEQDKTLEAFQQAVLLQPEDSEAHYFLGTVYQQQNNEAEAIKEYERAIKSNSDRLAVVNSYLQLGRIYRAKPFTEENVQEMAEKSLKAALSIAPGSLDVISELRSLYREQAENYELQDKYDKAAEKYEEDNSPIDSCDWQAPTEIVPAEVWPRAPFCTFEFPEGILKHTRKINTIVRVRRARLIQFSQELDRTAKRMEELEKFWHKMAQDIRQNLEKKLAATFPEEANLSTPAPRDAAQLIQWARGEDLTPRWAAALHPQLPEDVQAELASHWDFATRLSLAANPSVVPQILENLSRDVQPSVRAVATARLQRGTIHLTPLVGEILTPGEILWLLVAHPRSFFRFGSASYGDGSEIYAQWYKGPRGADDAWAYQGGLVYEEDERGKHPSHIGLNGLSRRGCGRYPCMYLEKEPYSGL